ncbi:Crp/Fnr family transcriptional regulator [Bradyrhizobium diazoefficiens]|uniref:Crp/Fnr family transcriptional regulator n=1 Tax=Bradyrhizobium diazoefficiens TaxID=1355477 RepID=UPI00190E4B82|nr:Crp/Fnr family transcriptional regulator [Bradyrhizobium diazoefficiens]MBK3665073.1 Crp/Fnr family transcriptional regulator [Bradyrhizobium diazoefficiens]
MQLMPGAEQSQLSSMLTLSDYNRPREYRHSVLDRLTAAERDLVLQRSERRLARKHSTIFRQGEPQKGIYLLLSGGVRVFYIAPSGREITRAYWFAGNFIGGPDVFGSAPHMWSAVATRDTSLIFIAGATLRTLCERIPNLAIGLIEAMAFKGRSYSAIAQMLGTRSANERMIQVLLLLTEMYGSGRECGTDIDVPITHEEIAHMVGATRQWVTKGLKRLQADGLIDAGRGKLVVHKVDALVKELAAAA